MARSKRTQEDPTGQSRNRERATRVLQGRLNNAEIRIARIFRAIPRTRHQKVDIRNTLAVSRTIYEYEVSAEELQRIRGMVVLILNDELLETQSPTRAPFGWYWEEQIEQPFRQGTLDEIRLLNQAIAAATIQGVLVGGLPIVKLDPLQVLLSEPYRDAVAKAVGNNFQIIKTLSDRSAERALLVIENGILGGVPPREIRKAIQDRFLVSKSDAKRIARTEVNRAYNNAKIKLGQISSERLGVRTAVMHISALIATTRATHAARHGNVYTPEAQLQWWDSGTARINCLCTTITVLVDRKGNLLDKTLQKELKAERVFFKEERAA